MSHLPPVPPCPLIFNPQVPRPSLLLRGLSPGTFWKMLGKLSDGEVTRVYFRLFSSLNRMDPSLKLLPRRGLCLSPGAIGGFSAVLAAEGPALLDVFADVPSHLLLPDQLCAWVRCLMRAVLLREEALRANLAFLFLAAPSSTPPDMGCLSPADSGEQEGRSSLQIPDGCKEI